MFLSTAVVSFVGTAIVRSLMLRLGIVDMPDSSRKRHLFPVAYEGGLALFFAFVVGLGLVFWRIPAFVLETNNFIAVAIGAGAAVCLGVTDDLLDLKAWLKLAGQLCIGAWMYYCGFSIEKVTNPIGGEQLMLWPWVSLLSSMFWYALLMNAINMIDGLDGLAAGIVGISALTLAGVAYDLNQPFGLILALLTAAACLGFLPLNFNPAKIFMGDAGSLLLGFLLATQTMISSSKSPALLALLVPMLAVGVPLFDLFFAFARRLSHGQHPFKADRRHLHHRFLAIGFSQRRTVLTFYYITAFLGMTAYMLQKMSPYATFGMLLMMIIGCGVLIQSLRFLEKSRSGQSQNHEQS